MKEKVIDIKVEGFESWNKLWDRYNAVYIGEFNYPNEALPKSPGSQFKIYLERPVYYKTEILFLLMRDHVEPWKVYVCTTNVPANQHGGHPHFCLLQKVAADIMPKIITSEAL